MMPEQFVLEGIHLDSGRPMNIVIRNDPAPNNILLIVQNKPVVQQCSLAAFAHWEKSMR